MTISRRTFIVGAAATATGAALPVAAVADLPKRMLDRQAWEIPKGIYSIEVPKAATVKRWDEPDGAIRIDISSWTIDPHAERKG